MAAPKLYHICEKQQNQWCVIALEEVSDQVEVGHYFKSALKSALFSIAKTSIIITESNAQSVPQIGSRIARCLKKAYDRDYNGYVQKGKEYLREAVLHRNRYRDYVKQREQRRKANRKNGPYSYIPRTKSGNWAILVSLPQVIDEEYIRRSEQDQNNTAPIEFTQEKICDIAQKYAKFSMKAKTQNGFNAFSNVYTKLIDEAKYMEVHERNDQKLFRLTKKGYTIGVQLREEYDINTEMNQNRDDSDGDDYVYDSENENKNNSRKRSRKSRNSDKSEPKNKRQRRGNVTIGGISMNVIGNLDRKFDLCEPILLNNGKKYLLHLIIDSREQTNKKSKRIDMFKQLEKDSKFLVSKKVLPTGDFCWGLLNIDEPNNEEEILLAPFLVERKTWSDLYQSIFKDYRFERQKYIMSFLIDNDEVMVGGRKIYLVEQSSSESVPPSLKEGCEQAVIDTAVADGFHVYFTPTKKESLKTLINWTYMIRNWIDGAYSKGMDGYELDGVIGKYLFDVNSLTTFALFKEFSRELLINSLSPRMQYMEILLTVKGCTEKDAWYISEKYKTLNGLMDAYEDCEDKWDKNMEIEEKQMVFNTNESEKENVIEGFIKCLFHSCQKQNPNTFIYCIECGMKLVKCVEVKKKERECKSKEERTNVFDPGLMLHETVKVSGEWKYRQELMRKRLCEVNRDNIDPIINAALFLLRDERNNVLSAEEPISEKLSKRMYQTFGMDTAVDLESD